MSSNEDDGAVAWGLLIMVLMLALGSSITMLFYGGSWLWPVLFFGGFVAVVANRQHWAKDKNKK